eukprot:COSAG04_NODE_287_length_17998_cov_7.320018_11_plen_70_part_00
MHIPDDELAAMPTGRNYTCDMTPFSPDCLPYMVQNNRSMRTWLFDVSHANPLEIAPLASNSAGSVSAVF